MNLERQWLEELVNKILSEVSRFEVIDAKGRIIVRNFQDVKISLQDKGRTLKVFLTEKEIEKN